MMHTHVFTEDSEESFFEFLIFLLDLYKTEQEDGLKKKQSDILKQKVHQSKRNNEFLLSPENETTREVRKFLSCQKDTFIKLFHTYEITKQCHISSPPITDIFKCTLFKNSTFENLLGDIPGQPYSK